MFYHFENIVYLNILHTKRGIFQIALFGKVRIRRLGYRFLESKYLGNYFPANLDRNFISCALFEARWQTMQNMKWIQVLNFYTERCVRKKWFWLFTFVDNYDESYCIIVPANNWVHEYNHEHILCVYTNTVRPYSVKYKVYFVFVRNSQRKIAIFFVEREGGGARENTFLCFFFHLVQRDPRKRRVKPVQKHLIQVDFGGADDSDDSDFELDKHKKGTVLLIPPNNNNINWFEWFEWKKKWN